MGLCSARGGSAAGEAQGRSRGGLLGAAELQLKEEGSDQKVQRPRTMQLQDSWLGRRLPSPLGKESL